MWKSSIRFSHQTMVYGQTTLEYDILWALLAHWRNQQFDSSPDYYDALWYHCSPSPFVSIRGGPYNPKSTQNASFQSHYTKSHFARPAHAIPTLPFSLKNSSFVTPLPSLLLNDVSATRDTDCPGAPRSLACMSTHHQ